MGSAGGDKATLRVQMRARLAALSQEERAEGSRKICDRILRAEPWKAAVNVLLFTPMRTEPAIESLGRLGSAAGKRVTTMSSALRSEEDLVLPTLPDLILVPGLAFSRDRHRMGRGGGFFDRLLAGRTAPAFKLAVCFEFQLLDAIPVEPHDIEMDAIVTDVGIY